LFLQIDRITVSKVDIHLEEHVEKMMHGNEPLSLAAAWLAVL
jgi:hypothetical protein